MREREKEERVGGGGRERNCARMKIERGIESERHIEGEREMSFNSTVIHAQRSRQSPPEQE